METRPFIILFLASLGLTVICGIGGALLESAGWLTKKNLGPRWTIVVLAFYFVLFLIMAFSMVPLAVNGFIAGQSKIGNGDVAVIRWLRDNARTVVYGIWGVFAAGLLVAFALAGDRILKDMLE